MVAGVETDALERPTAATRSSGAALSNDRPTIPPLSYVGADPHHDPNRTGSHRVAHPPSCHTFLEGDRDIRQELDDARAVLWQRAGAVSEVLAYPNGMYNRRVQNLVRSMGFKAALSTIPGFFTRESNPLAIPRIEVDNTTVTDTRLQLSTSRASFYFLSSGLRSAASY